LDHHPNLVGENKIKKQTTNIHHPNILGKIKKNQTTATNQIIMLGWNMMENREDFSWMSKARHRKPRLGHRRGLAEGLDTWP